MNDPRKEYVVQCIISVLNIPREEFRSNTTSNAALEKFLDDPNEKVLQAIESEQGENKKRTVTLAINFANYVDGCSEMHFVKTSYEPLTEENISQLVIVSSLRMSPVRSLFYNIREVFVPLLNEGSSGKSSEALEGRLAECLTELDAGLNASFRRGLRKQKQFDEKDTMGILSPVDEVRFWDDYKDADGVGDQNQERAAKFAEALSPVAADLDDLKSKTFAQLTDLIEALQEALESLWNCDVTPAYPQARMQHFMKVIAGAMGRSVQAKLNALKVWESSFSQVAKHIREGHKVCERWNEVSADLTNVQWRTDDQRAAWSGEGYKDAWLEKLARRIQEVNQLRSQHDQILKLLPEEELKILQVDSCFEPFQKIHAFSYNDYTVPRWKEALSEYENRMVPVQSKVADRLRAELFTDRSNPAQAVRVFQRYQALQRGRTSARL
mmetsp:Transcript_110733/g.352700  ORF Transcript_110733/g.352700 Transcript_110733/m.352700 type:complete len:440 (+) Transcript_110733:72-1391(+)